jgi:hypothetical protein
MSDYNSDVLPVVDFVKPPFPQEVGTALVNATLDTFDISNDGTPYFLIIRKKYLARKVSLEFL